MKEWIPRTERKAKTERQVTSKLKSRSGRLDELHLAVAFENEYVSHCFEIHVSHLITHSFLPVRLPYDDNRFSHEANLHYR